MTNNSHSPPPRWIDAEASSYKFVDDLHGLEKNDTTLSVSLFTTQKEKCLVHLYKLQRLYETIKENADDRGMVVNGNNTQLLCMSAAINSDIRSYIDTGQDRLLSGDTMKVLGFMFGRRPGAAAHVQSSGKNMAPVRG